jgi:16S rRNA (uracil1498-N3)-methyltransferase
MNLALLLPDDLQGNDRARLRGRRARHVQEVLRAQSGDEVTVGLLNGAIGRGRVLTLDTDRVELSLRWQRPAPAPLPLTLILALPRPKMLRRVLQTVAAMGVKKLVLLNSYKVEKSFWQTPWLRPEAVQEQLMLGLEQACDTLMPEVILEQRFKPFVEDRLEGLAAGSQRLVAHPRTAVPCPRALDHPVTLCIGPEGGFIPYEVDKLAERGFEAVHLGNRILRVENAVPVLIGRLFDSCDY